MRLEKKLQNLNTKDSETALKEFVPALVDVSLRSIHTVLKIKSYLRGEGESILPSEARKVDELKAYQGFGAGNSR